MQRIAPELRSEPSWDLFSTMVGFHMATAWADSVFWGRKIAEMAWGGFVCVIFFFFIVHFFWWFVGGWRLVWVQREEQNYKNLEGGVGLNGFGREV